MPWSFTLSPTRLTRERVTGRTLIRGSHGDEHRSVNLDALDDGVFRQLDAVSGSSPWMSD